MHIFYGRLLDDLAAKAAACPRGRAHFNIHASAADPVQRFFVVVNRQSYFRPHRHHAKSELAIVLRGEFEVIMFDDRATVTARHVIGGGAEGFAYETPRMTWHTLVSNVDGSAFLEIKEGPYDPATSAEFAPWAPPEGDTLVPQFIEWLRSAQVGDAPPV
jgi:cupin fold WbuC family metalloprotein